MVEAIAITLFLSARGLRAIQKAFADVPSRELRRRSAKGDETARRLYFAARYEARLQLLLEILIVILVCLMAALAFKNMGTGAATAVLSGLVLYFFIISPATKTRKSARKMAAAAAPYLAGTLKYASPLLHLLQPSGYDERKYQRAYNIEELTEILKKQVFNGSKIKPADIEKAIQALTRQDLLVRDVMQPKKNMKIIKDSEDVGPILLSELHKSGQKSFAVKGKGNEIIGTAKLAEMADLKSGGTVNDATDRNPAFVSESWTVNQAAAAYLKTRKDSFFVVNKKQEITGIVEFDTLLIRLMGNAAIENKKINYHDKKSLDSGDISSK